MVTKLANRGTFRVIAHRPAQRPIIDRLPSVDNREAFNTLEAITNPRLQQEYAARKKVRPADLLGFEQNDFVIAAFEYSAASRFTDGTYGVYYAAYELETAARESAFHTERFLAATDTRPTHVFKRVLSARVRGSYENITRLPASDPIYDPDPTKYGAAEDFARGLYVANRVDGILYNSVRAAGGRCVSVFRPNRISKCSSIEFLVFTYDGGKIDNILRVQSLANTIE